MLYKTFFGPWLYISCISTVYLFQCTFAATCATIVSGAIAERCNFNGYVIFAIIVTGVTYPISAHWCWGPDGWLGDLGFYDFAGSGVVHLSGGTIALVGTLHIIPIDNNQEECSVRFTVLFRGHCVEMQRAKSHFPCNKNFELAIGRFRSTMYLPFW